MDRFNGSHIDHYIIVQKLGEGGMGQVYLAHDPRLNRDVALKLLSYALSQDTNFLERFEREAKTIAKLEHPAIIPLYEFGQYEDQPYLTMRLMRGGTLTDRLANGPLSLAEANQILQRICGALDKAHENNIIHRDLKPANILFDDDGRAYLGDFGIARMAEGTQTMTIIGTPQYMAPEQAYGQALDARTDIYQMGVVLFQMLTGSAPYDAQTATALLYQHAHAPIPSSEEMNASLPPGCDQVLYKALAKEKKQRYRTAGELAVRFAAVVGNESLPQPVGFIPTIIEEGLIANGTSTEAGGLAAELDKGLASPSRHRNPRAFWWAGVISLLVIGIFGIFMFWFLRENSEPASEPTETVPVITETVPVIAVIAVSTETAVMTANSVTNTAVPQPSATPEGAISSPIPPSLMPPKTETPTLLPTVTPELELFSLPIPIDSIGNASSAYADLPLGDIEMNNIPFVLSSRIFKSQASADSARSLPTSAWLPINIARAQRIHLLLVAGNGFNRFAGEAIGRIEAQCSDSVEIITELELGRNIREWHAAENVVSFAYETDEVWRGQITGAPGAIGHIDLITLDLPPACREGWMTALEIFDTSSESIQSLDPALNLFALTVDYLQ